MSLNKSNYKTCIVGLGYVGLPLAARFSLKGFDVIGFDTNQGRIQELINHQDRNDDVNLDNLKILTKDSILTSNKSDIEDCNIFNGTVYDYKKLQKKI